MKVLSKRNVYVQGMYFAVNKTVEVPDVFEKEVKKNPFLTIVEGPAKKTRAKPEKVAPPEDTGSQG